MTVHSAEDNYGILRKIVLDQEVEEELSFNIKGKDAALLSKFEEFDISIKQNSIKFKSKNLKLSFQNYELVMHPPKMTDAIDINNLTLVSKGEAAMLNMEKLLKKDKSINKASINLVKLRLKIKDKIKKRKERNNDGN